MKKNNIPTDAVEVLELVAKQLKYISEEEEEELRILFYNLLKLA